MSCQRKICKSLDIGAELGFTLPLDGTSKFAALFQELDESLAKWGFDSYGISCTTLEEVRIVHWPTNSCTLIMNMCALRGRISLEGVFCIGRLKLTSKQQFHVSSEPQRRCFNEKCLPFNFDADTDSNLVKTQL